MLTAGGVLPPRDEELTRTGQWLTSVGGGPAGRGAAAGAGLRHLAGDAQGCTPAPGAPPARGPTPPTPGATSAPPRTSWPGSIAVAAPWPPAVRPTSIPGLAPGPPRARCDFLSWAARHGHCPDFAVPGPVRATGPAAPQDERWTLAARLLHDDTLDPTDRAAGCLLLLYGQQLSRIAAMTTSQITTRAGTVHVRLGNHDDSRPRAARHRAHQAHPQRPDLHRHRLTSPHLVAVPRRAARPARHGRQLGKAAGCAPSVSTPRPGAGPRSSILLPSCPPPSSPTCSAWPRAPQSGGCARPEGDWSSYAAELARTRHHQP